mmetsp:Transcript_86803/g.144360  ORF Transcript_86803/g.144360 Transcript_86803/m.144360 type:complete len:233 (-) Transcript_86803:81-779(-)
MLLHPMSRTVHVVGSPISRLGFAETAAQIRHLIGSDSLALGRFVCGFSFQSLLLLFSQSRGLIHSVDVLVQHVTWQGFRGFDLIIFRLEPLNLLLPLVHLKLGQPLHVLLNPRIRQPLGLLILVHPRDQLLELLVLDVPRRRQPGDHFFTRLGIQLPTPRHRLHILVFGGMDHGLGQALNGFLLLLAPRSRLLRRHGGRGRRGRGLGDSGVRARVIRLGRVPRGGGHHVSVL